MGNGRYIKTLILAILLSVFSIAGYGQSARWNYVMTIEPDNGNTTEPFLDMNGLGYYDNNARFLDILAGGFISRDALSGDYPHISHYSHCANNPLSIIDPTGMFVIADVTSQQNIINTLSPEGANFISFNEQGMIDVDLLNKSASMSENFTALKALANSEINYMFRVQNTDDLGEAFREISETSNYRGVTEMPGATMNPSPDGNVHIIVGSILREKQQVLTTAHEAYGHAYFYELTRDVLKSSHTFIQKTKVEWDYEFNVPSYTSIKIPTNIELEKQIKLVVQQALKNYENR
ncbi:MAG: hypothetical protein IJN66_07050 [Muribaculaceae bacterium]|nr:hypothetical protein [Muribaculaceae bacterium]